MRDGSTRFYDDERLRSQRSIPAIPPKTVHAFSNVVASNYRAVHDQKLSVVRRIGRIRIDFIVCFVIHSGTSFTIGLVNNERVRFLLRMLG